MGFVPQPNLKVGFVGLSFSETQPTNIVNRAVLPVRLLEVGYFLHYSYHLKHVDNARKNNE
ncbi:hypothetical protein GXM_00958 [Nostoc sphaeroides CCNUC1]|uniref:Uncharacterized protein n=1 Tax=Nostoc sphaeroides CCNUC1 TaxID=2653204 RepID=A0A5P8VSR7_9NOSO|nr:hypothetical protein GXM_00958 [Nostoc sphaeroides CCNUC1]